MYSFIVSTLNIKVKTKKYMWSSTLDGLIALGDFFQATLGGTVNKILQQFFFTVLSDFLVVRL